MSRRTTNVALKGGPFDGEIETVAITTLRRVHTILKMRHCIRRHNPDVIYLHSLYRTYDYRIARDKKSARYVPKRKAA